MESCACAEYATWQWMRWRWFLAGVAVVAVPTVTMMLVLYVEPSRSDLSLDAQLLA